MPEQQRRADCKCQSFRCKQHTGFSYGANISDTPGQSARCSELDRPMPVIVQPHAEVQDERCRGEAGGHPGQQQCVARRAPAMPGRVRDQNDGCPLQPRPDAMPGILFHANSGTTKSIPGGKCAQRWKVFPSNCKKRRNTQHRMTNEQSGS